MRPSGMGVRHWGCRIEKRLVLPYKQNTVYIEYRYIAGSGAIRLGLRPAMHFRNHDAQVDSEVGTEYVFSATGHRLEISAGAALPALRMKTAPEAGFTYDPKTAAIDYLVEKSRGYPWQGIPVEPWLLSNGSSTRLGHRADRIDGTVGDRRSLILRRGALCRVVAAQGSDSEGGRLMRRTGSFRNWCSPPISFSLLRWGGTEDAARARAAGDEPLTVIAGYHWFTDWGRDTMISLEGLTLVTGRHQEARWILRTFAHYVRDGLIPNMFPEGEKQGLYHTADASLWFFHAISRYLDATGDRITLRAILPKLHEIANAHIAGTRFGIHVDPQDGLLVQGEEGYQLTWMDAKVGDWVVTPRRGKAVEINALWYNALCLLSNWTEQEDDAGLGLTYRQHADRARASFNKRFWNPQIGISV